MNPVFGPNENYTIIASGFDIEGERSILGTDLYFVTTSVEGFSTPNFTVELYAGTQADGPTGMPLASQEVAFADIQIDPNGVVPTSVDFDAPTTVSDYFYIVVDYSASDINSRDANLASTDDLDIPGLPSWIFFNGSWLTVEAAFGTLEVYLWIDARAAGTTASDELPTNVTSVSAFPNPSATSATLGLELVEASAARVTLHDVLGRQVALVHDGTLAAGRSVLDLDVASLSTGVYVARIELDGAVVTRRINVVR